MRNHYSGVHYIHRRWSDHEAALARPPYRNTNASVVLFVDRHNTSVPLTSWCQLPVIDTMNFYRKLAWYSASMYDGCGGGQRPPKIGLVSLVSTLLQ